MRMVLAFMIGMRMLMGAIFTGVIVAVGGRVPAMAVIMSVLMPMIVTVFVGVRMAMSFMAHVDAGARVHACADAGEYDHENGRVSRLSQIPW